MLGEGLDGIRDDLGSQILATVIANPRDQCLNLPYARGGLYPTEKYIVCYCTYTS